MTVVEIESIASQLQDWCNDLNAIARQVQVDEITEDEAVESAEPIFLNALDVAKSSDVGSRELLDEFRNRLVPSVQRAWDLWIEEAWPKSAGEVTVKQWVCQPDWDTNLPIPIGD